MIRFRSRADRAVASAPGSLVSAPFVSIAAVTWSRYQLCSLFLDLPEAAGLDLVDEAADGVLVRDERAGLDPGDGLAHVGVQVAEGLERERGPDAGVGLDLGLDVVVVEGEHAAVGGVEEDYLVRPEQPLGDGEGPDDVVGHHPAGVADHVRVAL